MTSMLRTDSSIDKIFNSYSNGRCLFAISKIMSLSREEELVANSLKTIRCCIQEERNHQKTIVDYPDMINDIIQDTFVNF